MLEIQLKTKDKYTSNIKGESQKSWFNDDTMWVTARETQPHHTKEFMAKYTGS